MPTPIDSGKQNNEKEYTYGVGYHNDQCCPKNKFIWFI